MAHIDGKNGGVYTGAAQLIEDCEDTWAEQVISGVTLSTQTGKVGTNCVRAATVGVGITILMSEVISVDLSTYHAAIWWARSSITTAAGDLQILLDETALCASPDETLNIPALTINTWKQCFGIFTGAGATRNAIISVGLKSAVNLADGNFDVDDVEAVAEVTGIKSWTVDYTVSTLDTTDFASSGVRDVLPGVSQWSGSFEGLKDGVPLSIGTEYYLVLGESNTEYQGWVGKAVITGSHPVTAFDGAVSYSYDFEGTAGLEVPSA